MFIARQYWHITSFNIYNFWGIKIPCFFYRNTQSLKNKDYVSYTWKVFSTTPGHDKNVLNGNYYYNALYIHKKKYSVGNTDFCFLVISSCPLPAETEKNHSTVCWVQKKLRQVTLTLQKTNWGQEGLCSINGGTDDLQLSPGSFHHKRHWSKYGPFSPWSNLSQVFSWFLEKDRSSGCLEAKA